jgi:hypothetical protein
MAENLVRTYPGLTIIDEAVEVQNGDDIGYYVDERFVRRVYQGERVLASIPESFSKNQQDKHGNQIHFYRS